MLGVSPADFKGQGISHSARDQNCPDALGEELWTIMDTEIWPFSIAEGKLFWDENLMRTHFHKQILLTLNPSPVPFYSLELIPLIQTSC